MSHAFGEMIARNSINVEILIPVSGHFAGLDVLRASPTKVLGEGTSRAVNLSLGISLFFRIKKSLRTKKSMKT